MKIFFPYEHCLHHWASFKTLRMDFSITFHSGKASDFIWDFGKLPFPSHLGKYIIKIGKISTKIHKIWKIKAIFGLGMTTI